VLYGSHMHQIGAIWEPDCTIGKEDGTIRESHMLYESHMHQTGAAGSVWESDGTIWKPHVTYEDHMRAVCAVWGLGHCIGGRWCHMGATCTVTVWGPCGSHVHHAGTMFTMLEPCVPCGRHVGARWCHMGGNCHQMGAAWIPNGGHMGVMCAVWEPHVPYGSQIEQHG
jgi:hypothetical protein